MNVYVCVWIIGLRYDDLYDPLFSLDVKEALDRLPEEVVQARNQRLKRCMDLSMKHSYLSKEMQVFFLIETLFVLENFGVKWR